MIPPRPEEALAPQTRVNVALGAVAANIRALMGLTPAGTRCMAVVKANAYGHGAEPVARAALDAGADFLGVARVSEAAALRRAGIQAPILLFGGAVDTHAPFMAARGIRASVTSLDAARALSGHLAPHNLTLKVHIKVDTGMGRLGFVHPALVQEAGDTADQTIKDILAVQDLDHIEVEGIYTHLARADETDKASARDQVQRFDRLTRELAGQGMSGLIRHAANSAGVIELPESHFDMVRPGIAIYGLWPSDEVDRTRVSLTPAMTVCSRIIQVKDVPKGFGISYGSTHVTGAPTAIATVPIGYADGYSRMLSNRGRMLVRGKSAPILGRVCMDLTMIDVGHIPGAAPGNEVVIIGRQGDEAVSADEIARLSATINYEVTAGLTGRMPVFHTHKGESAHG